eukprot:15432967-Alexandrium_andersonii.AAC.1
MEEWKEDPTWGKMIIKEKVMERYTKASEAEHPPHSILTHALGSRPSDSTMGRACLCARERVCVRAPAHVRVCVRECAH